MKNGAKKNFNKKSLIAVILCAVIVFGIVSYDFISGRSSCEKTSVAMGTVVTVKLFGFGAIKSEPEIIISFALTERGCFYDLFRAVK